MKITIKQRYRITRRPTVPRKPKHIRTRNPKQEENNAAQPDS